MFGFECDCSSDCDGYNLVHNVTFPKAMFAHTCGECGRTIEPGEHYERVHLLTDCADWHTHKTYLGCYRIRERFCSHGFCYGLLAEQMQACLGFDYTADPSTYPDDEPGRPLA